ncbi:hypothetical protein TRFO_07559 [Tritrichomonas foetus]|uniref:Uncharacterized protein n=1 Tax=Tritrichomonas foetus TaxID=1144522 RepID=A0A1J4JUY0_9EUKA|nr:hypothetical protein TRFO_07559 [Tritrichomonas foetus]|eukprot:OHT01334.1 hypothetical protein TRFO_07559 [Tritrichomonas foetus]
MEEEEYSIESQVIIAQAEYPSLEIKTENTFSIVFPDTPNNFFEIILNQDFPDSAPLLFLNHEPLVISLTTYWHPEFSFIQILQHLHLYSRATKNKNLTLSPPTKRLASPLIYGNEVRNNPMTPSKRMISVFATPRGKLDLKEEEEDFSEEEETISEATFNQKMAALKMKFRKKQIITADYIKRYNKLKKKKVIRESADDDTTF